MKNIIYTPYITTNTVECFRCDNKIGYYDTCQFSDEFDCTICMPCSAKIESGEDTDPEARIIRNEWGL